MEAKYKAKSLSQEETAEFASDTQKFEGIGEQMAVVSALVTTSEQEDLDKIGYLTKLLVAREDIATSIIAKYYELI